MGIRKKCKADSSPKYITGISEMHKFIRGPQQVNFFVILTLIVKKTLYIMVFILCKQYTLLVRGENMFKITNINEMYRSQDLFSCIEYI